MTLHPERNEARAPRDYTIDERFHLEVEQLNAVIEHLKEMRGLIQDMIGAEVAHGNKIIRTPPPVRPYTVVNAIMAAYTVTQTAIPALEEHLANLRAMR